MSPTYGTVAHRLIPGFAITGATDPINASYTLADAYGFGTLSWDQYTVPTVGEGDDVDATSPEGGTVFEGKVRSVTDSGAVGERLLYHVECAGHCEELKADETVEGVFVDRDVTQWQAYSYGWQTVPDFEIRCDVSDRIRFVWPEIEELAVWTDDRAKTSWPDYAGNVPVPPHGDWDFYPPPTMWTACVYHLGNGATGKSISRLKFKATANLTHLWVDSEMTPDYEHPKGPYDAKYGYRHSDYPNIMLWRDYYGMLTTPNNAFAAVYVCDDVSDLPTHDPVAMRNDPHILWRWGGSATTTPKEFVFDGIDGQFVLFYAAYVPVYEPTWSDTAYDEGYEHLIRYGWQAQTRLYCEPHQFVELTDLEVCAQGYVPEADGSDDLSKVFAILYQGKVAACPPMKLPPDPTASSPRSIALRTPTNLPAAVADLLALTETQYSWGFYEDKELYVWTPAEATGFSCADEPGVDTTGCGVSSDGAVDYVLVAYTPPPDVALFSALTPPRVAFLVVDKAGAYTLVDPGWAPAAGEAVAYLDATQSAKSEVAAAKMGQSVAIERRRDQATGAVALKAIADASLIRPGGILSGPGVPADARITQVSVSVDADSVSLSLGATGYHGRFPARSPGQPGSASPTGSGPNVSGVDRSLRVRPVHS